MEMTDAVVIVGEIRFVVGTPSTHFRSMLSRLERDCWFYFANVFYSVLDQCRIGMRCQPDDEDVVDVLWNV